MSTRKHVYVVTGSIGEYSDATEWMVAAYADKAKADEHRDLAQASAEELNGWRDADDEAWNYSNDPSKPVNPYDPEMRLYYGYGDVPRYHVSTIPLLKAVPSEQELLKAAEPTP